MCVGECNSFQTNSLARQSKENTSLEGTQEIIWPNPSLLRPIILGIIHEIQVNISEYM